MVSNAYYLTGIYTCAQVRKNSGSYGGGETIDVSDAAMDVIVFSPSPEDARNILENALREKSADEIRREITIRKCHVSPIVGQLLTESGNLPLDWPRILQKSSLLESAPVDDFEQGYWVDVDQIVRPEKLSFSAGTIESEVTEDVRSALNWSSNKQFFFFLQVLPVSAPPVPAYEQEGEEDQSGLEELSSTELDEMNVTLPETVAVIQARNSVVAAWLWRTYAANTQWASNAIRITPMCGTLGEAN